MKISASHLSAITHLKKTMNAFPNAQAEYEGLRNRIKQDVPEHIFTPLGGVEVLSTFTTNLNAQYNTSSDQNTLTSQEFSEKHVCNLYVMSTWNVTKGIYEIPLDVRENLYSTSFGSTLNTSVFKHTPEWCVYIPAPENTLSGRPIAGFFIMTGIFEELGSDHNEVLLVHILLQDGDFFGVVIPIGEASLEETCQEVLQIQKGLSVEAKEEFWGIVHRSLSLYLYLCSKNTEVLSRSTRKIQKFYTKADVKTAKININHVGIRIGSALVSNPFSISEKRYLSTATCNTPHIRRAHWHGYWTGPLKGTRSFELKWIPPLFVGGKSESAVVRTV